MPKINIENLITRYVGRLVGEISDSTTTPSITISPVPYKQVRTGADTFSNTFLDEIGLIIDGNKSDKIEQVFATSGVDNGDGTATYTLTPRGILNSETANPPVNAYSSNYKSHSNNALVLIDWTWAIQELNTTFLEASVEVSAELGEDILELKVVAIDVTDGLLYKYDTTNSNHRYCGMLKAGEGGSTGETKTFIKPGGLATGLTGLTTGQLYYADTGTPGDITITANAYLVGQASNTTSLNIERTATITELSQAQVEDDTSTDFGLVSGQRLDQFVVDSTKVVHTTGAESVAGVKTFTDSPIVPNGATGTDAINAGEVDTKISSNIPLVIRRTINGSSQTDFRVSKTPNATQTTPDAETGTGGDTTAIANEYINNYTEVPHSTVENSILQGVIYPNSFSNNDQGGFFGVCGNLITDQGFNPESDIENNTIGFWFAQVSGALKLYAYNCSASTATVTEISSFTNNNLYHLMVKITDGSLEFYSNGSLGATHTTNIPTFTSLDLINLFVTTSAANSVQMRARYIDLSIYI